MEISCPKCHSTKIKKNGRTHNGKQNHKCKRCFRQFILKNTRSISDEKKSLIFNALKERNSLRSLCRIFEISMNWLQPYARSLWAETPNNLGLSSDLIERISHLQLFGLQADEMWSFVQKKKNKRWIWIAYDPVHRLVVAHFIGKRNTDAAKEFRKRIPDELSHCTFETDDWDAYKKVFNPRQHRIGKKFTYFIEGFNATVRARVSRLVRKTLSFSKEDEWHKAAIAWFFWQFNMERQPYF